MKIPTMGLLLEIYECDTHAPCQLGRLVAIIALERVKKEKR